MASDSDTTTPDKGSSGTGLIQLILLAVTCAIGGFAAVFFLSPNAGPTALACEDDSTEVAGHTPLALEDQAYVELQDILVTIGNEPATRYVKIKMSVISNKDHINAVKKAEPMLVDAFVGYLRALQLSEFESADFYPKMREQLSRRSEIVLGPDASQGVLITEFLLR